MTERTRRFLSGRTLATFGAIAGLALLLLYLSGAFEFGKVAPGKVLAPQWTANSPLAKVEEREVVEVIAWPGSVNSRFVAHLAAKLVARIEEVRVNLGDPVQVGQLLVRLDDREIRAKVDQARAALAAAEAEAELAAADLRRVRALFEREAATQQERDAAEARARSAEAARARARQALNEAEAVLAETTIVAPFSGVIAARMADPGDLATPGRPLLVVHDPTTLRFEANVAESAAAGLHVGQVLTVRIDNPPLRVEVPVAELAPRAEMTSRTVLVKLTLPSDPRFLPGAYGSLEVPAGKRKTTLLPARAVLRRGQLEMVYVQDGDKTVLRQIRTGKVYGEWVEVLSGLAPGTQVAVPN